MRLGRPLPQLGLSGWPGCGLLPHHKAIVQVPVGPPPPWRCCSCRCRSPEFDGCAQAPHPTAQGVSCITGARRLHTRTASNNRHSAVLPEDEKGSTPSAAARCTNTRTPLLPSRHQVTGHVRSCKFVWPPGHARGARWPWNLRLVQRGPLEDSELEPRAPHPCSYRGLGPYPKELSNGFRRDMPTRTPGD